MFFPRAIVLVCLAILFGVPASAQQTESVIRGRWTFAPLPSDLAVGRYTAHLLELTTGDEVAVATIDARGSFTFRDVPLGSYQVELRVDDERFASRSVDVASNVPVDIAFADAPTPSAGEVTVVASRIAERTRTASATLFTAPRIESIPSVAPSKRIEGVLLNTPGVVPDEDGRLHVRGEDAQLQYVIDGIPVSANMTRIYGSLFDARLVKSMLVQTGGFDAEYGVATSGVLEINTRSGFDAPFFARASGSVGSFASRDASLQLGGNIGSTSSAFVAASAARTDRYLDPVASFDPLHDAGDELHLFGKLDVLLGPVDVDVLTSVNRTDLEIPNRFVRTPAQDQRLSLRDMLAGLRLTSELGDAVTASLVGYLRRGELDLSSGGLHRIASSADSMRAVTGNERYFIGAERTNTVRGAQAEISFSGSWLGLDHSAKAGAGFEVSPLDELFTFAIVDPALAEPDTAGGDARLARYDITRGGRPFLVDTSADASRISFFVQDRFVIDRWTVSAGLRFDRFDLFEAENALSPRIGLAYQVDDAVTLRASYNRLVMQAPLENILTSSSSEAMLLSGGEQGAVPTRVRSEKSHAFEIGAVWMASPRITLQAVAYGKLIEDFIVKAELGNSGIIFPINLKDGLVAGGEITAALRNWNAITATLTVSSGVALGMRPEDGSSPIAAGLIIGEEGHNYAHPFAAEDVFPTEHSQLLAASLNARYDHSSGLFAVLGGRFDSGLPFDLTDSAGSGLTPEAARAELRRRGYADDVIDLLSLEMEEPGSPDKAVAPHGTIDIGIGFDFEHLAGVRARVTATATNVLDTRYLYKFESSFGGTHFGVPRALSIGVALEL